MWALAICALLVLLLKTFVADVYYVTSSSMVPSIFPPEVVLVLRDRSPPERFEMVAVRHEGENMVKRVAALGRESLLIDASGDLRVDGAYLPPDAPRPAPVPVFDDRFQSIAEEFDWGDSGGRDQWADLDGVFQLDARGIGRSSAGMLRYHPQLRDNYLDREGNLVQGIYDVHDAVLEVEVWVSEPGGELRAVLVEQGDTFEFSVDLSQPGRALARLTRERPELEVLAETTVELELETWTALRIANIDNHLTVEWGQESPVVVVEVSYEANTFHPLDTARQGKSFGDRVRFGGRGCRLRIQNLRILRDMHWTQQGRFAVGQRHRIGPGEVFLLGDYSAESLDSRDFGALPVRQILGRPVMVVWPPSAIRWL